MYKSLIKMNYNKRLFTDYKFLKTIINDYTLEHGFTKYVTKLEIDKYNEDILGMYLDDEKNIIIYQNKIIEHCNKYKKLGIDNIRAYNMDLLITLFHELEHAKQARIMDNRHDFISKILRDNDNLAKYCSRTYNKYYSHMLEEYNAQINALIEMDQIDHDTLSIIDGNLVNFFTRNYKYDSPYQISANVTGFKRKIPELSLNDRVIYGLPLEENEKQKVVEILTNDSSMLRRY